MDTIVFVWLLWTIGGGAAGLYLLSRHGENGVWLFGPILGPVAIVAAGLELSAHGIERIHARRELRESRLDADYREVVNLIEWTPRPVTALDELRDALEVEQMLARENDYPGDAA